MKLLRILGLVLVGVLLIVLLGRMCVWLSAERPEIDGQVEAVTVCVKDQSLPKAFSLFNPWLDASKLQPLRIYYSYQIDGIWHDIPFESYQLIPLQNKETEFFDVKFESHVVQIGEYALICLYNDNRGEKMRISDTLGTEILSPMEPYVQYSEGTETIPPLSGDSYALYYEDATKVEFLFWPARRVTYPLRERQYLIVPVEQHDSSYEIFCSFLDVETGEPSGETRITGADLLNVLNQAETVGGK